MARSGGALAEKPGTGRNLADLAPRAAIVLTVAYLVGSALVNTVNIIEIGPRGRGTITFGLVCNVTVFAVQFLHCASDRRDWPGSRKALTLGIQAVLAFALVIVGGPLWGSMLPPLAGSVVLLLSKRLGWTLFVLITGTAVGNAIQQGSDTESQIYAGLTVPLGGFAIYGLTRLSDLVREVHAGRDTLARMAVTQERLRVARDLHDLLGYSLSAITLKFELIRRLIPVDAGRAEGEAADVLQVSRQALSDVRLVARGYRDLSLAAEVESAREVLATAGIHAEEELRVPRLRPQVDTVLATVLREGVTNALRHSDVTRCGIRIAAEGDAVRLTLENDGAGEAEAPSGSGGGLDNLRARLDAVGGTLTVDVLPHGRFRLTARVPAAIRREPDERTREQSPAASGPDEPWTTYDVPPPRMATAIILAALVGYAVVSSLNVVRSGWSDRGTEIGLACNAAAFALQFLLCPPGRADWSVPRKALALGVQAAALAVPLANGVFWGSMAGPLAGSVLLLLSVRAGWAAFGVAHLGVLAALLERDEPFLVTDYVLVSGILTALIIYGLTRLSDLVREVHAGRDGLARMAVTQERLRVARDLHDLLGYSLSAITLKCELIRRLIPLDAGRAEQETGAVLEVSRQALSDVRLVARGYRDMSLEAEVESAREVLATAGIRAEEELGVSRLHPQVDTVLATVLREGITNALRHSDVNWCSIRTVAEGDVVRLVLENDGTGGKAPEEAGRSSGGGLDNLRTRLADIGGTLTADTLSDGHFRLTAESPAHPETVPHSRAELGDQVPVGP